jgi:HSP20 family protein
MADRMDQQRPADDGQMQGDQNKSLARRDDQGSLSYYRGGMYSPFELMRRFSDDVDRMFASLGFGSFGSMLQPWGTGQGRRSRTESSAMSTMAWAPSVDVNTRGDDLMVSVDLPGIKPENVQLECDDNQLIIRGETKDERSQDEKERGYWYSERSYGSFYRSIPLPQGVNPDNARANFNNGVLEVTFPGAAKSLKPQRRRIEIQGAQQSQGAQSSQQTQSSQTMQGSQNMQGGQSLNQSTSERS